MPALPSLANRFARTGSPGVHFNGAVGGVGMCHPWPREAAGGGVGGNYGAQCQSKLFWGLAGQHVRMSAAAAVAGPMPT